MNPKRSCITPFMKQCYVTTGVSLNLMSHGLVTGYTAVLLPQLQAPDSHIKIDQTSESWIASVFGITSMMGNFICSVMMDKLGRKKTNLISIGVMAVGWYMTVWSSSVTSLIISRIIQGFSLGISINVGPTMIGEYTSPCNRGAFLATINLAISCGTLIVHTLGSYLHWQTTALICAIILTIDFLIVIFSPESPSWLMDQGRYDECKTAFRWLRGFNEEEELQQMIADNSTTLKKINKHQNPVGRLKIKIGAYKAMVVKEEFYKPSLIVIHFYVLAQWGGTTILSQFTPDVFTHIVGDTVDTSAMIAILAVHRFVSGIYMTFLIDKFKRKTMLISLGSVTVISLITTASYAYMRQRNMLPFDHPSIGIVLIHIHTISICSGCLTLGFIIAGELFPFEYKGIAGGLSAISLSGNMIIIAKTEPYLLSSLGIHVIYCIYAVVTTYCLLIINIFLPETKGRTLKDIEDGFRKKRPLEEAETTEPLNYT